MSAAIRAVELTGAAHLQNVEDGVEETRSQLELCGVSIKHKFRILVCQLYTALTQAPFEVRTRMSLVRTETEQSLCHDSNIRHRHID